MKDLIDRQAAMDAVDVGNLHPGIVSALQNIISEIPSAQQWIPCSEMLPEVGESVLCQCRAGIFMVLKRTEDRSWKQDSTHVYMHGFVIAWMPLPESYRGDKNGQ